MVISNNGTHHELHVARSRCFRTSSRYLLTEVSRRYDSLGECYSIVRQENTLESLANDWIVVNCSSNVVEQLDDQLGCMIAWGSLQRAIIHAIQRMERHRSTDKICMNNLHYIVINIIINIGSGTVTASCQYNCQTAIRSRCSVTVAKSSSALGCNIKGDGFAPSLW